MPSLSVIVPVYNVEKYLPECIESILRQSYDDLELILADDGSDDKSGEICDRYAASDARVRVIHQVNGGVSRARNAALDMAAGEYLGYVDADDWIDPDMYERLIKTCREQGAEIAVCGMRHTDEEGVILSEDLTSEGVYDQRNLMITLYSRPNPLAGSCCNKVFLRSAIEDNRFIPELKVAEDWIFLFDSYIKCSKCVKISDPFYNIRGRRGSATRADAVKMSGELLLPGKAGDLLLLRARGYSSGLESYAVEKYLDDCVRYTRVIRREGEKQNRQYRGLLRRIRLQMLKVLGRTIARRLLPAGKIRGYLHSAVRMR